MAFASDTDARTAGEMDPRVIEAASGIIDRLHRLATDQVNRRNLTELRWVEDLRLFHGKYDADTESQLFQARKSRLFVNQTRPKTNAWEARLSDMLFPTDDKNWGVKPTPVPELSQAASDAADMARQAAEDATLALQQGGQEGAAPIAALGTEAAQEARRLQREMAEAKKRADSMEKEIADQLKEAEYNSRCRRVIHDACTLGLGVMKGPLARAKPRRRWREAGGMHVLEHVTDPRPEFRRVDPWSFFPDMSARTPEEWEFTFERYLYTRAQMRKLLKDETFIASQVLKVLGSAPKDPVPDYLAKLRDIAGADMNIGDRYTMWEYHGSLEASEVITLLTAAMGNDSQAADMLGGIDGTDPTLEIDVILFFCDGLLLKIGLHPLESGETLYSVYNFEEDDSSVFGFGVPYLMRDSQAALNAAWRMMMDNGKLSVGPQVVVDKNKVEPGNGNWSLEPLKIWYKTAPTMQGEGRPFETFTVDSNQAYLINIINLARQFADDETNMPVFAQGEAGARSSAPEGAKTMGGLAMLMNSVNVIFRRLIKQFDDTMTVPNIRRLYDWNMQFNPREEIKGDMEADARGSSVLLVREIQAQNLMSIATAWTQHPVLMHLLKAAPTARKTLQALLIDHQDLIKTDEEILEEEERRAAEPAPPTPEEIRAQAQLQAVQIESETRLELAMLSRETELIKLAEQRNMQLEDLAAKLQLKNAEVESKERIFASEAAIEERQQRRAAQMGVPDKGSGGYIS